MEANPLSASITAATLLAVLPVSGSLLLHEPFDYDVGPVAGQGGSELGFDASSTWRENSTKTTEIQAGSMSFGTLATSGNSFHYNTGAVAGSDINKVAYRGMDLSVADGELYITYLMQGPRGLRLNGGVFIATSIDQEFGALRSRYNSTQNIPSGEVFPSLIYGAESIQAAANVNIAITYMYVQRYTGLGSSSGGTAQLWLVREADYDTVVMDGVVTPAELDANSLTSTPVLTLAGAAPTLGGSETLTFLLHDSGGAAATDYVLDEIRIATTLEEAMGISIEPSGPIPIVSVGYDAGELTVVFTSENGKTYSVFGGQDLTHPASWPELSTTDLIGDDTNLPFSHTPGLTPFFLQVRED